MSAPNDLSVAGAQAMTRATDSLVSGTDVLADLKAPALIFTLDVAREAVTTADKVAAEDPQHGSKRMKLLKAYAYHRDGKHARLTRSQIFAFGAHSAYRVAYEHERMGRSVS